MTDTGSQLSALGSSGGDEPCDLLACFDRHGSAVFASLCRVTAGDRHFAAEALRKTFVALYRSQPETGSEPTDRRHLLLAAHRVYLADRRADDYYCDDEPVVGLTGGGPDWALGRWSETLTTLRGLTSRERAAINLHLVDGLELGDVSELLQQTETEVAALIESGQRALLVTGTNEPLVDLMRHAEMWLGDDERDEVRVELGAPSRQLSSNGDAPAGQGLAPRWRPTKGLAIAAVAVGVLVAVAVRWVQTLPEVKGPAPVAIDESATPVPVTEPASGQFTNDESTTVDVTPLPDAVAATEVILLASGLTDPAVVVPDAIIKYSDGKVGLSWHSPCNRPALALAVTNTTAGAVVELTTGEFPVVSCTGMPSRWSAVVEAALPLADGIIRPVGEDGSVVTGFGRYVEANALEGSTNPISDDAGYGSALVDDADQPWVYGTGCSSRSTPYQSPVGAIFEIRTNTADPDSFSSSDEIVCNDLASRPVLTGPVGATFPQPNADGGGGPIACEGPSGSLRDVRTQPPSSGFNDGSWSTWDGCLVRNDVIFSQSLFEACVDADLRTITFAATIGERITSASETLTFIRDPGQIVVGTRPPFLTYMIAPPDLQDTGLRYGGQQLWLAPRSMDAIYVRVGETAERWPRLTDAVACA